LDRSVPVTKGRIMVTDLSNLLALAVVPGATRHAISLLGLCPRFCKVLLAGLDTVGAATGLGGKAALLLLVFHAHGLSCLVAANGVDA
jgi:hypothetical protein